MPPASTKILCDIHARQIRVKAKTRVRVKDYTRTLGQGLSRHTVDNELRPSRSLPTLYPLALAASRLRFTDAH